MRSAVVMSLARLSSADYSAYTLASNPERDDV